jgi:hypothetical protein
VEVFRSLGQLDGSRVQEIECMEAPLFPFPLTFAQKEVIQNKKSKFESGLGRSRLFEVDPYVTIVGGLSCANLIEGSGGLHHEGFGAKTSRHVISS